MHKARIGAIFVVIMIVSAFALLPMITTAVATTFSNSYPVNSATDVELTPTLHVTVNDAEGDTMNITFRTNATGAWGDIGSNNSMSNGTYYQTNSSMNSYSTKYWWSVNCTDSGGGNSWTNTTYNFTTRAQYVPDAPASFTATIVNRTKIDLSWTDDTEADSTRVEWHTADGGSWDPGGHNLLYNGSAQSTSDTGLDPGTHHYYKAWSWNNTDNCWSSGSI